MLPIAKHIWWLSQINFPVTAAPPQAPAIPELVFLNNDCAAVNKMFAPGSGGSPCAEDAFSPEDVAWYRAALQKPGAAGATLNYYR